MLLTLQRRNFEVIKIIEFEMFERKMCNKGRGEKRKKGEEKEGKIK